MKLSANWRIWIAQLYIVLAIVVLAWLALYCVADYDFVAVRQFARAKLHDSWFLMYLSGGLLSAALLLMLGVRHFIDFIRERDDFVHAAVHDLRTPVAGLKLLLDRNGGSAALVVERMRRMIENLNDFVNRGGRRPKPRIESFDIVAAFREAYLLLEDDFSEEESGPIAVEGDDRALTVSADRTRVVQIFWNLLGNELK